MIIFVYVVVAGARIAAFLALMNVARATIRIGFISELNDTKNGAITNNKQASL